jgi:TolB-like protein/DNA-binding winged helix-turn-helix (wHTH) protein/Tfp pilus assembly protein PilF
MTWTGRLAGRAGPTGDADWRRMAEARRNRNALKTDESTINVRLHAVAIANAVGASVPSSRLIRFGLFELDLRSGELRKQGGKIRLEGQPVDVLICLLESPGELVTREELHRRLWSADTFVNFEHGLNAAVKRLRQALNDSAGNPRFVETLPRRGYRFIAPIHIVDVNGDVSGVDDGGAVAESSVIQDPPEANNEDEPALSEQTAVVVPPRRRRIWMGFAFALLLVIGVLAVRILRPASRQPQMIRSLAVLPLENLSGDVSQDYFSDGMTDELITELGQIGQLRVISRTSAMTYKGTHKSLPEIARDLNVDAVVEGAVLRSGKKVRITAQLILAPADKHLWARSYEGDLNDTFALQKQVARSIAGEIRIELTPHEQAVFKNVTRVNPEAYEAYLKGRYFWNKRTADGLKEAIDYFNQAIEKDPNYAAAYAGLTDAYALAGDWKYGVMAPRDAYPKAAAAATKALELDSSLGEAHISRAFCLDAFDWDWESAGREFTRGIELSPGYATGYEWYGWHLAVLGRNREAVAEVEKAASLDPLSLIVSTDLAEELMVAHRYDEAIKQTQKAMNLDPFFAAAHFVLGEVFVQKHLNTEAVAEFQKAIELSPGSTAFTANLAYAYAVSGMRNEAVKILDDLKNRSQNGFSNAPEIALVYVGLNDKDQAMAWLEKAYAERFSPWVLMRPAFDPLLPDPRFRDLLRRIGLRR